MVDRQHPTQLGAFAELRNCMLWLLLTQHSGDQSFPVLPFGIRQEADLPVEHAQTWGSWCARYYSLFTLGMLVVFECTTVMQRLRSLKELRTLQTPKQALMVHRAGRWDKLPGDALVPGDVISIGRPSGAPRTLLSHLQSVSRHPACSQWWRCGQKRQG